MLNIKIVYDDGDFEYTKINATIEDVRKYYVGRSFNLGITTDNIKRCKDVEILN